MKKWILPCRISKLSIEMCPSALQRNLIARARQCERQSGPMERALDWESGDIDPFSGCIINLLYHGGSEKKIEVKEAKKKEASPTRSPGELIKEPNKKNI
ncbi:unnamed protein product [Caretta caretta]